MKQNYNFNYGEKAIRGTALVRNSFLCQLAERFDATEVQMATLTVSNVLETIFVGHVHKTYCACTSYGRT